MPQLAKKLLLRTYDSNPSELWLALQKKGDPSEFISEGSGGLGRAFVSELGRKAFDIRDEASFGRTCSVIARDLNAMWEMTELFRVGGHKASHFNKNQNKRIICLVFIIMQPVTIVSIPIQERAYSALLDIYGADFNYSKQLLNPGTQNGVLVYKHLEDLKRQFNIDKTNPSPLQKSSTLSLVASEYPSQNHIGHGSRENSGSGNHVPAYAYDPTPQGYNPYGYATSPRRASGSASSQPEDAKFGDRDALSRGEVFFESEEDFLQEMTKATTTQESPNPLSVKQIKNAHLVFFFVKLHLLSLTQLTALTELMENIQIHPIHNEKRFDPVRTETGWIRRFFYGPLGNTETWTTMGNKIQGVTLDKLVKERRQAVRPDLPASVNIPPEMLHTKLSLTERDFHHFHRLFKISFTRNPSATPDAFNRFKGQFTQIQNTDTASLLRRSKS
jgi:hypothetical protein